MKLYQLLIIFNILVAIGYADVSTTTTGTGEKTKNLKSSDDTNKSTKSSSAQTGGTSTSSSSCNIPFPNTYKESEPINLETTSSNCPIVRQPDGSYVPSKKNCIDTDVKLKPKYNLNKMVKL